MGIFKDKEDYLKKLCVDHPIVMHGAENEDRSVRNSFWRINGEEEAIANTLTNIDYPCVGYLSLEGRLIDSSNALTGLKHNFKNAWVFLHHINMIKGADGKGLADKIQAAYDTTFDIMEDFIKYMVDDYVEFGNCGTFTGFDPNRINYVQVGPYLEFEYGWILYFEDQKAATRING